MSALSLSISSIATKLNPNHQVLYIGCMTKIVANCVYLASKTQCRNEIPYRKMIQNVALEVNFERWHFHKEAQWTMNRSFTATSSKIEFEYRRVWVWVPSIIVSRVKIISRVVIEMPWKINFNLFKQVVVRKNTFRVLNLFLTVKIVFRV